jgi:hypothetical protein
VAPEKRDLPPVAAPTNQISVAPIPVVRSESEAAGDFGSGLMQGLIASGKVKGGVLVAVRDDHVIIAQHFGTVPLPAPFVDPAIVEPPQDASTLEGASNFLFALANGGLVGDIQNLQPAAHPALPGHTNLFDGIRRNGWTALVHDHDTGAVQSRLVVVPEAKLAYLISFAGRPGTSIWQSSDDALFDKMLPSREPVDPAAQNGAAPSAAEAEDAAGTYEAVPSRFSFLKTAGERLRVTPRGDGALLLAGSDSGVLLPRPGGYWGADDGNLNAVLRDGELLLSTGAFRPLPMWKWPLLYAVLAMAAAVSTAVAVVHGRRSARVIPKNLILGGGGITAALVLASLLVWLLSPGI